MAKQPENTKSESGEASAPETFEETQARLKAAGKKGAPTPSRAQQEAARKRPLVPDDRKEAARQAKLKSAEARERARVGMAAGEDKYLPQRDRGPQKRYARDYIDARFSVGELLIPLMFVVIILTLIPNYALQSIGILALWAFFAVAVIDVVILGQVLTKKLRAKYGDRAEKIRWYAAMRALQLRPLRLPKPQVKYGQYPE
ncbi:DUF3043 domain-containing protein [Agromyces protaetiae]|uniref:DUF3043 domain-containing protein n=1 Tax=Agromyces protaetiae TaxID=2509455 RepID=A0A4P6FG38_9MICO|nr:DUF3043 domain-containing protein [Agromyces protaetiae]QAY74073.1 DUF3043 domain-containing protein [Agromyces protaetiae]